MTLRILIIVILSFYQDYIPLKATLIYILLFLYAILMQN